MMKSTKFILLGMLSVFAVSYECIATETTSEDIAKRRAFMQRHRMKQTGGKIIRPGTDKGLLVFVIASTNQIPINLVSQSAEILSKQMHVRVKCMPQEKMPAHNDLTADMQARCAQAAAYFMWDTDNETPLIYAPERHWAVINCSALHANVNEQKYLLRLRKEIIRAFSYLCGSGASMGGGGIMGVTAIDQLDTVDENLELDITSRYHEFLKSIGISQWEETTYFKACQQGWAPAPTNEFQKAIWDKVHAMPTAPIQIKPETKKVEK